MIAMLPSPDRSLCFARSRLTGAELKFYDLLASALQAGSCDIGLGRIDANRALEIAMLVMRDHPEFYWAIDSARAGGSGGKLEFVTSIKPDEATEKTIALKTGQVLSALPTSCSDYTKAKHIFSEVVSMAAYDTGDAYGSASIVRSHGLCGVLVDSCAVCDGFASTMQYLLHRCGIQAYRLTGFAKSARESGPHAWVLARVDGDYYHIDPTWGILTVGDSASAITPVGDVDFDYFCVTDKDIAETHFPNESIPLPECRSKISNYYRKEGYYLQAWDEARLVDIAARQLGAGRSVVSIRAATKGLYEKLLALLHDGDALCRILAKAWGAAKRMDDPPRCYGYTSSDMLRSVHVHID